MTEIYKWLGTSNLRIPETEKSVITNGEFDMGHNQLSYSGIQKMMKDGLIVKVTGVKPTEKIEMSVEEIEDKSKTTVKGVKPIAKNNPIL